MISTLVLLAVSLGAGMLARHLRAFPKQTPAALNALILDVALPALVVRELHSVALRSELALAAAMLWVQFLLSIAFFAAVGKALRLSRRSVGALILTGGLSNTAFVGFPVIEAALGPEALPVAILVDQLGSFLVMGTLGMAVAAWASGQATRPAAMARRVLLFPPFIALVAAIALRPVAFPPWAAATLDRLGGLVTPLALFSVGFQLELRGLGARLSALGSGLLFKLALSPAIAAALFALFAARSSVEWKVTVLQCAMPPMVTGGILAAEHDCDPPLAAAMLGIGIPLSAATLAVCIALVS